MHAYHWPVDTQNSVPAGVAANPNILYSTPSMRACSMDSSGVSSHATEDFTPMRLPASIYVFCENEAAS